MATASDYRISALPPDEVAYYTRQRLNGVLFCSASTPKATCWQPVLYETAYAYISGQRGRRTMARRRLCLEHAKLFCERWHLELPEATVLP